MQLRSMSLIIAVLCLAAWQLPLCGQQIAGGNDSGPQITIRLVAASDTGKTENAQALGDVLPLFEGNMHYTSYALVCKHEAVVMEGLRVKLDNGFAVSLSEVKKNVCTVTVDRAGKALVTTRLRLEAGRPVVLSGFPDRSGVTFIVVINIR